MAEDSSMFEKMMEMGMSMTVMSQIPQMMNGMMPNVQKPVASPPPLNENQNEETYLAIDGRQAGPFSNSELVALINKGVLTENTLVWKANMSQWTVAKNVPQVNKLLLLN
ncbi:MAG: DUF4339 domain-containing protein [Bacteroidaceae bacterium]|nr:DUF4339 domain-containing protein [Bacteroidaceae bacterium]